MKLVLIDFFTNNEEIDFSIITDKHMPANIETKIPGILAVVKPIALIIKIEINNIIPPIKLDLNNCAITAVIKDPKHKEETILTINVER
ncbi:MAG: hypothetical protein QM726_03790 [Chitinophagaceae bacterium]